MHGKGTFYRPAPRRRRPVPDRRARPASRTSARTPDLVTPKLAALHLYQLAIPAPAPPAGSFDAAAAARGKALFDGKAACATLPRAAALHRAGLEHAHARGDRHRRLPGEPLAGPALPDDARCAGLWTHQKGGFYHDGRFATLPTWSSTTTASWLGLSDGEKNELVEYLKSL